MAVALIDATAAFNLTPRERAVMQWVCEGKRDREIATVRDLIARTVQLHVGRAIAEPIVKTCTAAVNQWHSSAAPHSTKLGRIGQSRLGAALNSHSTPGGAVGSTTPGLTSA